MPSPTSRRRTSCDLGLGLALATALGAAAIALSCGGQESPEAAAKRRAARPEPSSPTTYVEALAMLDAEIREARSLAGIEPDDSTAPARLVSWSDLELLARLCMRRARLSGNVKDWLAARNALDAALALAPEGGGPTLTRAELALALHQLDDAERWLATARRAPLHTAGALERMDAIEAELARGRNDHEGAAQRYGIGLPFAPEPPPEGEGAPAAEALRAAREGLLHREAGDYDGARAAFDRALARMRAGSTPRHQQTLAWLALQRGLVEWETDNPKEALRYYQGAHAAFPDWWLVTEHRAEAHAALGEHREAISLYRQALDHSHQPELMDALAALLQQHPDLQISEGEAGRWRRLSKTTQIERERVLPELARAHDHTRG